MTPAAPVAPAAPPVQPPPGLLVRIAGAVGKFFAALATPFSFVVLVIVMLLAALFKTFACAAKCSAKEISCLTRSVNKASMCRSMWRSVGDVLPTGDCWDCTSRHFNTFGNACHAEAARCLAAAWDLTTLNCPFEDPQFTCGDCCFATPCRGLKPGYPQGRKFGIPLPKRLTVDHPTTGPWAYWQVFQVIASLAKAPHGGDPDAWTGTFIRMGTVTAPPPPPGQVIHLGRNAPFDSPGHIIAKQFGGFAKAHAAPDLSYGNYFPQNPNVNQGSFAQFETNTVAIRIPTSCEVCVQFDFSYPAGLVNLPYRPNHFVVTWWVDGVPQNGLGFLNP